MFKKTKTFQDEWDNLHQQDTSVEAEGYYRRPVAVIQVDKNHSTELLKP